MTGRVSPIWRIGCELGEGPVWYNGRLWFVDIKGRRIHAYHPGSETGETWESPEEIGFIQPCIDGNFIAGLRSGLYRFHAAFGSFLKLTEVESPELNNRLNDGAVDATGHLWFGSMHDDQSVASGALYRLDADGVCRPRDMGYIVTNGPAFSLDGGTLYHTDTLAQIIYAFDCAPCGRLDRKRVFVRIDRPGVYPDGIVVDADGCLWTCLFGGGAAQRYTPDGELVDSVEFPCSHVTKLAFGGPDLRTAYVTTAWCGLSQEQRAREPDAGALFMFRTDTPGLPTRTIVNSIPTASRPPSLIRSDR